MPHRDDSDPPDNEAQDAIEWAIEFVTDHNLYICTHCGRGRSVSIEFDIDGPSQCECGANAWEKIGDDERTH